MICSSLTMSTKQRTATQGALRFAKALWLFTESDLATFVVPNTVFGISGALAGFGVSQASSSWVDIFRRIPLVFLFNWLNLLVFDVANQRLPAAVLEDKLNKPWRPIPSGLMSSKGARVLLIVAIATALAFNYQLDVASETAMLICLTWIYNDLEAGEDYRTRNLVIAFAFAVYNAGSLSVSLGPSAQVSTTGYSWVAIISGVIFTTMHVQDLKDQTGDKARNRRTAPLVLGDGFARWTIALPVLTWSVFCPIYWRLTALAFVASLGFGFLLAGRTLLLRDPRADSVTWKLWTAWTALVYSLPLWPRML